MRRRGGLTLFWFFIGLGSRLQVVASLSISEIVVLIAGPILLAQNFERMRRDGVVVFFWLALLAVVGCVVACLANHTDGPRALRGLAAVSLVCLTIPVAHWFFRRDAAGYKWMLLGSAISFVLGTFWFQSAVEMNQLAGGASGSKAVEGIMSGPIFWIGRLSGFVTMPARGWYLQTPLIVSALSPIAFAAFAMFTTESGRSAALGALASAALCLMGRKSIASMRKVQKNFWSIVGLGFLGVILAGSAYRYAAMNNFLGEKAYQKYLRQTKGEGGIMKMLMGGRAEAFAGLLACRDKPILGFGPWAYDDGNYWEEFLSKYGDQEDYQAFVANRVSTGRRSLIPAHSYIVGFWLWYGIFGLLFWLYVIFVLLRFLKQDCAAVPQWYFWLACGVPGMFWGIFFSPFADRIGIPFCVVACLMARAARKGRFILPHSMQMEIWRSEMKRR